MPGFKETPYWWEAAAPSTAPPGPLPERADVVIVGAGYCGLSAALELRRQGVDTLVLDGRPLGSMASSMNGGMVSGNMKLLQSDLAALVGPARATALLEEAAGVLPFLEGLLARETIECEYRRTGRFVGAHCPKAYEALVDRAELLRRLTGMPVTLLPRARQGEEIATGYYHGGMVVEASGGLHPALYQHGLAAAARRGGAVIVDSTPVIALTRGPSGFRVRTTRGEVQAREVMVATNGYTTDLTPWLRRRLIPLGSYMIATEPIPEALARRLVPRGRMIADTKRVLSYYRLSPDGSRVLFGGRASFRQATAREAAPRLHAFMTAIWPELRTTRVTHAWTGNVAFTFDFLPHLGVHEGVHYAAGCQGSGVAMATYLGYRTALKIAGKDMPASAFDGLSFPTRPLYTGTPWFLPVVGGAYRFRDWLERLTA